MILQADFTYDNDDTMLIIQSKSSALANHSDFDYIEPYIELLISHESVHFVIKKIEKVLLTRKC